MAGGTRRKLLGEKIAGFDPDVVALTEYRTRPGLALCAALNDCGWPHLETSGPAGNQNGIAVFSRTAMQRTRACPAPDHEAVRWLDIEVPEYGFGIGVPHIVAAGTMKQVKTRFWDAVLAAAEARLQEPFLIGDFNTGVHRVDESGSTFKCSAHFAKLSAIGWTDLWRHYHTGTTEWTWFSKAKGGLRKNGFRLDHAFATPSLLQGVTGCHYSHSERDAGISDHSIMINDHRGEVVGWKRAAMALAYTEARSKLVTATFATQIELDTRAQAINAANCDGYPKLWTRENWC